MSCPVVRAVFGTTVAHARARACGRVRVRYTTDCETKVVSWQSCHLGNMRGRNSSRGWRLPRATAGYGVRDIPTPQGKSGRRIGTDFRPRAREARLRGAKTRRRSRKCSAAAVLRERPGARCERAARSAQVAPRPGAITRHAGATSDLFTQDHMLVLPSTGCLRLEKHQPPSTTACPRRGRQPSTRVHRLDSAAAPAWHSSSPAATGSARRRPASARPHRGGQQLATCAVVPTPFVLARFWNAASCSAAAACTPWTRCTAHHPAASGPLRVLEGSCSE